VVARSFWRCRRAKGFRVRFLRVSHAAESRDGCAGWLFFSERGRRDLKKSDVRRKKLSNSRSVLATDTPGDLRFIVSPQCAADALQFPGLFRARTSPRSAGCQGISLLAEACAGAAPALV